MHVGAFYLTSQAREPVTEELVQSNLGRLGSWLRVFQPQSTLADSPALTDKLIQSYEDYDANFRTICQAMKSGLSQRMQTAAAERQEAAPNTQEELAAIRGDFLGVGH